MGYYTDYGLSIENGYHVQDEIEKRLEEISGYALEVGYVMNGKWYDHDKDMIQLSKEFPDVTFYLEGNGEEQGDVWKAIFKNGKSKVVKPEIVWPELKLD